jgi:hypothetical protein
MLISPVNTDIGMLREKELGPGKVVGFEFLDFVALLWNNDYSIKVVWLG